MISGKLVKIRSTHWGKTMAAIKKRELTLKLTVMAKPVVFRMLERSFAPKYCAMNVALPLVKPKSIIQWIK